MDKYDDSIKMYELLQKIDERGNISAVEKSKLEKIDSLSLKGLRISTLPESIRFLKNLSILDVSSNLLLDFPEAIGNLTNLRKLDVSDNQLNVLQENLSNLTHLEELIVFDNNLSAIPESIASLVNLKVLDCSNNEITALPHNISALCALEVLSCSSNRITAFPVAIEKLSNLSVLDISNNPVYILPEGVCKLKKLRYLDLSKLHLHSIPEEFVECGLDFQFKSEKYLENGGILLSDVILDTQPIALFMQSHEAISSYYNSSCKSINHANVFFLGDGGVGKTYIINRIWKNGMNDDVYITKGIECTNSKEVICDTYYTLNIWDFGGQAILHSLYTLLLKRNSCYVITISNREDITDFDSRVEYWLNSIKQYAVGSKVLIVENKFFDIRDHSINISKLARRYNIDIDYISISAKNDNLLVLKERILDMVSSLNYPSVPQKWNEIKEIFTSHSANQKWINIQFYYNVCLKHGIYDNETKNWLLNWFNDLGFCLYCDKTPLLKDKIIITPSWIVNLYYPLLRMGQYYSVKGLLNEHGIAMFLNDPEYDTIYSTTEINFILDLYEQYGLIKRISDEVVFIPALLPDQDLPENVCNRLKEYKEYVKYELVYPYLPSSLLHQVMIKHYVLLNIEYCSRNRVVLEGLPNGIFVIISKNKNIITIEIYSMSGVPTGVVLQALLKDIRDITSNWSIEAKEYVYAENQGNSEKFLIDDVIHAKRRDKYIIGEHDNYSIDKIMYSVYGTSESRNVDRLNRLYSQLDEIETRLDELQTSISEIDSMTDDDSSPKILNEVMDAGNNSSIRENIPVSIGGLLTDLVAALIKNILIKL